MKEILIDELAYLIKQAKESGQPQPIFFLGAGASASGNIPLAGEIANNILSEYSDSPFIKKLKEDEKTYSRLMECLLPNQRNELLKRYIAEAKINVTHIYLAQLLKNGFVDYVLTVNFDNLMLRALALFNEFPSTYDMAILKDLTTTTFKEQSVVYLHGQHHGLWLLNTKDEMDTVKAIVPRIFDSIKNQRPWVFIGYSGSDPIFEHIKSLGRFDNGLYWVGYHDHEPGQEVREFLTTPNTNAFYIKGYDADAFMLKLNETLGLEQPEILDKPFSSLQAMLGGINDINDAEHFKGVKERLEMAKKDVAKSIRQFEMKEKVSIEERELEIDRLKKEIIDILISESYDGQEISEIEGKAARINEASLNNLLAGLFSDWGVDLGNLAEKTEGAEADKLFHQAFEKYRKSVEIKADYDRAYYNWGTHLGNLAENKKGKEAEELYHLAFEKFAEAIRINPDGDEAFFNWGTHLGNLADIKGGKEAEKLHHEAFKKFNEALRIKPDNYEAYENWAISLGSLAETKKGKESEELFLQAFEKYRKAAKIKPDSDEVFYNWGTHLGNFADSQEGEKAEQFYQQAFDKYRRAAAMNPKNDQAFYNWGTHLGNLADHKEGLEAEQLYLQAFDKYHKAVKINPNSHEAFQNWATDLGNFAEMKEGLEAEQLYDEAFEKFDKAIEYGGTYYNYACLRALCGMKKKALDLLDKSLQKQEITAQYVLEDEDWEEFWEDSEFKKVIAKYSK
ncbi:MAG: SIR2 family protein [Flavobacteriales bacterium]|nr:SIR2 family protein [Flavobacteriales bacterium]